MWDDQVIKQSDNQITSLANGSSGSATSSLFGVRRLHLCPPQGVKYDQHNISVEKERSLDGGFREIAIKYGEEKNDNIFHVRSEESRMSQLT